MKKKMTFAEHFMLWIALLIPGIITAFVDFDISMFVTYALAASFLGMKAVLLLILVYGMLHVINGVSGRIVIVTGTGLVELIREHFGIRTTLLVFIATYFFNLLTIIQSYLALALVADMLKLNFIVLAGALTAYIYLIIVFKLKKFVHRMFPFIAMFYFALIIPAVSHFQSVARSLLSSKFVIGDLFRGNNALFVLVLLGSTASAWNQLLVSRYTYRTKLDVDMLEFHILDNRVTTILSFLYSLFFMGSVSFLFPQGVISKVSPLELSALVPLEHPEYRVLILAMGLLFVMMTNIHAVSISFTHVFSQFFGIQRTEEDSSSFTGLNSILYLLLNVPAILAIFFLKLGLFQTVYPFGLAQGVFVVILLLFLYYFSNSASLMGRYRGDVVHNAMIIGSVGCISVLFVIVIIRFLLGL